MRRPFVPPGVTGDPPVVPYERPPLPAGAWWGRAPHNHGGRRYVYPGRAVLQLPGHSWPREPERCCDHGGTWWATEDLLVCRGCGVDVT